MHSRSSSTGEMAAFLGRIAGVSPKRASARGPAALLRTARAQLTDQQATRKATSSRSTRRGSSWDGAVF